MEGDAVYFSRRASEERAAASHAVHEAARLAHLEMADRYEELAASLAPRQPQLVQDSLDAA